MTRANVRSKEAIRSPIIDELDWIREKRASLQKSKISETGAAAVTCKGDLTPRRGGISQD
jgi:hypothetical protein